MPISMLELPAGTDVWLVRSSYQVIFACLEMKSAIMLDTMGLGLFIAHIKWS